jgi:hypothetical protein
MKPRPQVNARSERVAVDSVFTDGSARLLRAKRKADRPTEDMGYEAWSEEEDALVSTDVLENLLSNEFMGRRCREGDVYWIPNGDEFFAHIDRLAKWLGDKGDSTQLPNMMQELQIAPVKLLRSIDESKDFSRRAMKTEVAKLVAVQGISDETTRKSIFEDIERVVQQNVAATTKPSDTPE